MIPSRHEDYEEEGAIVTARSVSHAVTCQHRMCERWLQRVGGRERSFRRYADVEDGEMNQVKFKLPFQ